MNTKAYCFAGCKVKLVSDTPVLDSEMFDNFRYEVISEAECDIEISILHSALPPQKGVLVFSDSVSSLYTEDGIDYYYSSYPSVNGVREVSCRVTQKDKIILYVVPGQELWDSFVAFAVNYTQLLFLRGIATLHCSCIELCGEAILFAGNKGVGKSTQAALWNRYRGTEIINGDRIALTADDRKITAHGIPFCGSSKIACNKSLPVKAVVLPDKAKINTVSRLGKTDAFKSLIGKLTYNSEDVAQLSVAADIAARIAEAVPVFSLRCTADESAVNILEEYLCQI